MVDTAIPDDVRDYIIDQIDSIAQLEAVMLLRAQPGESWDVAKISRRLYVSEAEVSEALDRLVDAGTVCFENGVFSYSPAPGARDLIERVTDTYRRQLIAVTNLIHSKPSRIQKFANAFKFRKDR